MFDGLLDLLQAGCIAAIIGVIVGATRWHVRRKAGASQSREG